MRLFTPTNPNNTPMNPNSIKTENVSHLWYQRVLIQTHLMYTASYRWCVFDLHQIDWIVTQSQMQTYRVSSVDLSSIIKSVLNINIISACLRYFVTVRIDSILYTWIKLSFWRLSRCSQRKITAYLWVIFLRQWIL